MPNKIIQLGPWRRDGNFYDVSGEGAFLLEALNVSPVDGGYTGPPRVSSVFEDVDDGATYGVNGDLVDMALATENGIYASLNSSTGDKLIRANSTGGSWEDVEGASAWTSAVHGGSLIRYGDYVIAVNQNSNAQFINDRTWLTGTNFADLIATSIPTGSASGTANFRARYGCVYRNHLVLANITMLANYPSPGTAIYSNNVTYGSIVWISMDDNIQRYGSPTVHPELRGSIPLDLNDSPGSITGIIGGESVYVFKQDSIYRLVGPPFDAIKIAEGIGTVANGSIINVKGAIYFMSNHGPAVIYGNEVRVLGYERFMNALINNRHSTEIAAGWVGPTTSATMLSDLLMNETQLRRIVAMYSDTLGCIVWFLRTGYYICCRVNDSGDMSVGVTGDFFSGNNISMQYTAVAKMPDWLSNTLSNRNVVFRAADSGNNIFVSLSFEDYSGFDGTTVPSLGAYKFTLPMMPYAADQDGGILTTRLTGFRIIGEVHRNVRTTLVRTAVGWNQTPVITDRTGTKLQSRDGWVNLPNTYAGKYHSLAFQLYDDVEETDYLRRPFFSAVDVRYEVVPERGA